jgi:Mg2+/Co2+ transporter CorC
MVMDDKIASLSNTIHVLELVKAQELTSQTDFPVTDEHSYNMKLIGSILRKDIFSYLNKLFISYDLENVLRLMLPKVYICVYTILSTYVPKAYMYVCVYIICVSTYVCI